MATKYYMAENAAGRLICGQQFEITEIFGGTTIGVFQTDDPAVAGALDGAGSAGVSSITQAEYGAAIKKKLPSLSSFPTSNRLMPQVSMGAVAGVVVAEAVVEDLTEQKKLETVEGALGSLGKVESAPQIEQSPKFKKR